MERPAKEPAVSIDPLRQKPIASRVLTAFGICIACEP
jgi:hypothetical protein